MFWAFIRSFGPFLLSHERVLKAVGVATFISALIEAVPEKNWKEEDVIGVGIFITYLLLLNIWQLAVRREEWKTQMRALCRVLIKKSDVKIVISIMLVILPYLLIIGDPNWFKYSGLILLLMLVTFITINLISIYLAKFVLPNHGNEARTEDKQAAIVSMLLIVLVRSLST